jgi:hypothetical protein
MPATIEGHIPMKLPIALAALFLAATTAVPAFAASSAPRGTKAYAASPRAQERATSGWGHCIRGEESSTYSAWPAWDVCRG